MSHPGPIDHEVHFGTEELFFSVTDRESYIRTGNDVFRRIAGYDEHELIGKPHNIIRHPDMPRCVFRLFWDRVQAGLPIAAYVKNMAKDGSYYWVAATAVPIPDGYLSVRQKPTTPYFAAAQAVYADVIALERRLEAAGVEREELIGTTLARLGELLAGAGFPDYEHFMWKMLPAELAARQHVVRPPLHDDPQLRRIREACDVMAAGLEHLFGSLDQYAELSQALTAKAAFVNGLSDEIRLFGLNTLIASARLKEGGPPLGIVADSMRQRSGITAGIATALDDDVRGALERLPDIAFDTAIAKLQTEMATSFVDEVSCMDACEVADVAEERCASARRSLTMLASAIEDRTRKLGDGLAGLEQALVGIAGHAKRLDRTVKDLDALQISGRIEVARIEEARAFTALFDTVRQQLADAATESRSLVQIAEEGRRLAAVEDVRRIAGAVLQIEEAIPLIEARHAEPAPEPWPEPDLDAWEPLPQVEEPEPVEEQLAVVLEHPGWLRRTLRRVVPWGHERAA